MSGGALGTKLPQGYGRIRFRKDLKRASEFIDAMERDPFEAMRIAAEDPEAVDAFGRATAYMDAHEGPWSR